MHQRGTRPETACFYPDNGAHLADELRRLDVLIGRRIASMRAGQHPSRDIAAGKGIYIADEEVDALLQRGHTPDTDPTLFPTVDKQLDSLQSTIDAKVDGSIERGTFLALPHLADQFALSRLESQAVAICLAPELDDRYDTLYAYLQDDITRKRPSVELILKLLCGSQSEQWRARPLFTDQSNLLRTHILVASDDPRSPSGSSGLARFLRLDQRVLSYLLCSNAIDARLDVFADVLYPTADLDPVLVEAAVKADLARFVEHYFLSETTGTEPRVIHFHGPKGVGKRELALALCHRLDCVLLHLDMESLVLRAPDPAEALRIAIREAVLLQAVLYIDGLDSLFEQGPKSRIWLRILARLVQEYGWLTILSSARPWSQPGIFSAESFDSFGFPVPGVALRQAAWARELARFESRDASAWAVQLAGAYRLTPGQIRDASVWADHQRVFHPAHPVTVADFFAAARAQSHHRLGELAVKVEPRYGWEDLVLPEKQSAQLREICGQMKHRHRVLGEWGFDRKLSHGKGLSALFAGPSGTGKTMAGEVVGNELQLDLYKIDLSGVVSKYIGETEKNLSKIFDEAESSNAILFFDEADALFGRRTKVTDAHDRYANIETSYLLQKIETYEGMVILATNLRDNIDQAFTRRIRFLVEFPFPEAAGRSRIWKAHFPAQAPTADDLDFAWLGDRLQITGGNIKNIALNAAFLAAEDGAAIGMDHVLRGAQREFEKIGKVWNTDYDHRPPWP